MKDLCWEPKDLCEHLMEILLPVSSAFLFKTITYILCSLTWFNIPDFWFCTSGDSYKIQRKDVVQPSNHFYILSLKIVVFSTVEITGKFLIYILQLMTTFEFLVLYNIQPYIFIYVRFLWWKASKIQFLFFIVRSVIWAYKSIVVLYLVVEGRNKDSDNILEGFFVYFLPIICSQNFVSFRKGRNYQNLWWLIVTKINERESCM